MQLVSVLSISRRIRSCSAAVSTLAILHVPMCPTELNRQTTSSVRHLGETLGALGFVAQRNPGGRS